MERPSIYLAGPEVFLPDAAEIGRRKQALCAEHGFVGLFPLDDASETAAMTPPLARAIYRGNTALMRRADLVIANLTPFRGPSADAGTAFELGMMAGLGKPVLGYTNVSDGYIERAKATLADTRFDPGRAAWVDAFAMLIEDFGLADNLMLDMCLAESGFPLVRRDVPEAERFTDLGGFIECLRLAQAFFAQRTG